MSHVKNVTAATFYILVVGPSTRLGLAGKHDRKLVPRGHWTTPPRRWSRCGVELQFIPKPNPHSTWRISRLTTVLAVSFRLLSFEQPRTSRLCLGCDSRAVPLHCRDIAVCCVLCIPLSCRWYLVPGMFLRGCVIYFTYVLLVWTIAETSTCRYS